MMEDFFSSGFAADVVLGALLLEFVILWRRGWAVRDAALMLMPAALIVLALRAALVDLSWVWIALPLALAFPAHLADLKRRKK